MIPFPVCIVPFPVLKINFETLLDEKTLVCPFLSLKLRLETAEIWVALKVGYAQAQTHIQTETFPLLYRYRFETFFRIFFF